MLKIDERLPMPKYLQIAHHLQTSIEKGDGEIGMRYYSDREIVRKFGVSVITVRQAVEHLVRKGMLRRDPSIGTFLVSRAPQAAPPGEFGLFVFDLTEELRLGYGFIYSQWMQGLIGEFKAHERRVAILDIEPNDDAQKVVEQYAGQATRWGGFAFGEAADWCSEAVRMLVARRVPHVILQRFPWVEDANACYADTRQAGVLAARHLMELGHREIAYVGHIDDERFEGFRDTLLQAGIPLRPDRIFHKRVYSLAAALDEAARAAAQALSASAPPTAIFAGNDARALGILRTARDRGVAIPRQLSVMGVDDMPDGALAEPPLTTVRWPWVRVGRMGAQALLEWEQTGDAYRTRSVPLPPELVVRASTGPAPR